jgi:hypothetical protein
MMIELPAGTAWPRRSVVPVEVAAEVAEATRPT